MNDLTNRFLEVYEYLIALKEVANKADFAQKIDISNSLFTEISKGRSNVGVTAIQNTVSYWDWINPRYILNGVGNLDLRDDEITSTPNHNNIKDIVSTTNRPHSAPPTKGEFAPPTAPPTRNLGMPMVVTVNQNNDDLVTVVNAKAAAGYLNGYADPEFMEKLPTLRIPNLKGGTHRAFEVKGHSMSPTMHNGSLAIGRYVESFDEIKEDYVYIVVTKTDGIVIKRVLNRLEERGTLILKSDNINKKDYPNIILDPSDVLELWRLRGGFIYEFPNPTELKHQINTLESKVTMLEDFMRKFVK